MRVGAIEVVALYDTPLRRAFAWTFPDVPEEAWAPYRELYPAAGSGEEFTFNTQGFLLRLPGRSIVVDTGLGPGPHERLGGLRGALLDNLRAAGVEPVDIDTVLFTHLHGDHVGWNMVDGEAVFARARHLVPEEDWRHFGDPASAERYPHFAQQLAPLEERGMLERTRGEEQVAPGVRLLPTPGHTPGHQSLLLESQGERAMLIGDVAHHPAQVQETAWGPRFDEDSTAAASTRHRIMERLEAEGPLVIAGHFPAP
ncbi:MAG: MBL fold metallo-hydrolase, partial [Chloroflexi bacterium]|nr:MBL fold metallo-hydrolase [Chloroflexota bacterium]